MRLSIAIQMDPIEAIDIETDSTFRVAREIQSRGHELFYYLPQHLSLVAGEIRTRGHPLTVRQERGNHFTLGNREIRHLDDFDVVFLRQDPPFDMAYITTTHLLERLRGKPLVVNDPFWVRNHPEKILALDFPDLIPETAISRDMELLRGFRSQHGDVILKPIYGNGGAGVFRVRQDDPNFNALCEMFLQSSREPLIIQKFLPEVGTGDKRVLLVNGKPVGAINRVPAKGEARSNLHVGGRAEPVRLTQRDHEICARIGPLLARHGQIFVGIDVIGGMLTEINVTSPTGINELERFEGINTAGLIMDSIEAECG
ncbi:MAG: glutathione synthase [Rhodobacteraceae bacterium]|nr:glutathione synthase [Paracoccaceae bacterium]